MTAEEAAWLRVLRDEGSQSIRQLFMRHPHAAGCFGKGWSDWIGDPGCPEEITPAGLAALAEYEARG